MIRKKICFLLALFTLALSAQENQLEKATIIHDSLSNGLEYFIMQNSEPENRASFYFAQNVGSILENDSQQGLAHFLEHMAFNGTENFKDKEMLTYLEQNGLKFGTEINAYTSFDQTVYNINQVPVTNEKLLDSVLLILHDWSGYLSLTDEEIDNERGVVNEEWRSSNTANYRASTKVWLDGYLKDSKYSKRMPIGKMDIVNNFEYDKLRDYYERWYRPDQQAVIVVGDIDPKLLEQKVKDIFSEIPLKEDLPARESFDVTLNKEPLFIVATDKELGNPTVEYFIKHKKEDLSVLEKEKRSLVGSLANYILNNRLSELSVEDDSPVLGVGFGIQDFVRPLEVLSINISPKKDSLLAGLDFALSEYKRFAEYGATSAELKRAKAAFKTSYTSAIKNVDKRSNDSYASAIIDAYLENEPVFDYKSSLVYGENLIEKINNNDILDYLSDFEGDYGRGVGITGTTDYDYPEKNEIEVVLENVKNNSLEPYEENLQEKALINEELQKVEVTGETKLKGIDAKEYTLANGLKIVTFPTDFEKEQVYMSAFSPGGQSLIATEDLPNVNVASYVVSQSGLGDLDKIELQKKLAGKEVSLGVSINNYSENITGGASTKDLEILFKEVYLNFTAPRFDANALDILKQNFENSLEAKKNNINSAFQDSLTLATSGHSNRSLIFNRELIDNISLEGVENVFKNRIANGDDFTFVFVGDFDEDRLVELAQKYLGNIPKGKKETIENHHMSPKKGLSEVHVSEVMETPQTTISIFINGEMKYTRKANMEVYILAELLNKKYMQRIREEEGGSYGVSVGGNVVSKPVGNFNLNISFNCNPDKAEDLLEIVYEELETVSKTIDASNFSEIKNNIKKNHREMQKENGFWLNTIVSSLQNNLAIDSQEEFEALVDQITISDIKKTANRLNKNPAIVEGVLSPKAQEDSSAAVD
ncbi:M16 family metallopeptidase [Zunongwangia endophytica]|uniref:M16 family metallopeptidase n=1 Tax=Zunongwangia endophytica TaxID=1808945 RepID=A0ABV8H608_9FLAO|nr:M16 family metallopeptidase [Zunongwangia endophytica]MDN3595228.1 insulinase family protein [Zunongwangia endophytica]